MRHLTKLSEIVKILTMVAIFVGLSATIYVDQAAAISMGPYTDVSSGSGEYEWDSTAEKFDVDSTTWALGFALATTPLGKGIFSYRLNVGLEGQELEDDLNVILDLGGITCENVFAFAIFKKTDFRWWAGPLVRVGFYTGETDIYYTSGTPYRTEYDFAQFGVGAVTGLNIKVGKRIILSPSVGVRFIGAAGTGTKKNLNTNFEYVDDITGNSTNLFFNFALLF